VVSIGHPGDPLMTDTNPIGYPTRTVSERRFKVTTRPRPFGVTWRHWSRDHETRSGWFPVGGSL